MMSEPLSEYYNQLITWMTMADSTIQESSNFHGQVKLVRKVLKNDKTGMINTILDFMIQSACTDIKFQTDNSTLTKRYENWKNNVNAKIAMDIPRGFRSLSEQYFRERWTTSFIVLNIVWDKIDGYIMPTRMWLSDGGNVYAKSQSDKLGDTLYYIGKAKSTGSEPLKNSEFRQYLIRKPYNHWYDEYPTPYFYKKGAIYHALFKEKILNEELKTIAQLTPAMTAIKMGSVEAMRQKQAPTEKDLKDMQKKFQGLAEDSKTKINKKLIATLPFDVEIQNLIPDLTKVLESKNTDTVDKNLLMSLGLIEFKGFSTNREESILNPKPLVEEITDAVSDWVELLSEVAYLIQEKNEPTSNKFSKKEVRVVPGVIKSLMTDNMRALLRAIYDRGLISKESIVENTTPLDFTIEVQKRTEERKNKLEEVMAPPIIMNNGQSTDTRDIDPNKNESPEQKKSEPDLNAFLENKTEEEKEVFTKAYKKCLAGCEEYKIDEDLAQKISLEYAEKSIKK
jgi:hypothetical protein